MAAEDTTTPNGALVNMILKHLTGARDAAAKVVEDIDKTIAEADLASLDTDKLVEILQVSSVIGERSGQSFGMYSLSAVLIGAMCKKEEAV